MSQTPDIEFEVQEFLLWEAASRDTIDFKKIYVDMTGDLIAGLMLSQIVFWHLPDAEGNTRLRVERNGHLWLVKARHEWWGECRVTDKQARRALKTLKDSGLIETGVYKFSGTPRTHIRIDWGQFIYYWKTAISELIGPMDLAQRAKSKWPKGPNQPGRKGQMDIDQRAKSLTKNTTETTAKTFTENTTTTTGPDGSSTDTGPIGNQNGVGVVLSIKEFLIQEAEVWEEKAVALATTNTISLEFAAHWWTVIRNDKTINNPAAVLIYHLEKGDPAPKIKSSDQRHRYQEYLYDYQEFEAEEE